MRETPGSGSALPGVAMRECFDGYAFASSFGAN